NFLGHSLLAPFECLCGNFILPEPASYVFFYAISNLRNLLYIITLFLSFPKAVTNSLNIRFCRFSGKHCFLLYTKNKSQGLTSALT
ncbi:hypothetical protein NE579_00005, partial [Intestinimonas massiliensis]